MELEITAGEFPDLLIYPRLELRISDRNYPIWITLPFQLADAVGNKHTFNIPGSWDRFDRSVARQVCAGTEIRRSQLVQVRGRQVADCTVFSGKSPASPCLVPNKDGEESLPAVPPAEIPETEQERWSADLKSRISALDFLLTGEERKKHMREDRTEETTEPEKTLPMEKVIPQGSFFLLRTGDLRRKQTSKKRRIPHSKTGLFSFRKRNDVDSRIRDLRDKRSPGDVLFSGEEEKLALLEEEYELRKPFAEGGQGELYQGFDRKLHRLVAVKSLHRKLSDDPRQRSLFLTEARVTGPARSSLHRSDLHAEHRPRKRIESAMKLIHGETLREYLTQIAAHYRLDGVHSFDETKSLRYRLEIFLKVCDALEYAHNRNVMHGDLKPANIMIGEYHETYIMDWVSPAGSAMRTGAP